MIAMDIEVVRRGRTRVGRAAGSGSHGTRSTLAEDVQARPVAAPNLHASIPLGRGIRIVAGLAAVVLTVTGARVGRVFQAARPSEGTRLAEVHAPVPGVWIFARAGCSPCEAHLAGLGQALGTFPDSIRTRLARQIVVIGTAKPPHGAVHVLPDSLRRTLGVVRTPETWFVDDARRLQKSWFGARGLRPWIQALGESDRVP